VLVRFNHITRVIANANHSIVWTTEKLCVSWLRYWLHPVRRITSVNNCFKFISGRSNSGDEGTIDSTGTLTIGEHARIRGEIRTKSVKVGGTVEGNIFVTERRELQASCTLRGDIEAPRLVVNENAIFLGSAKVGTGKSLPAWRSPAEPNAISNAKFYSRSQDALIRVYDSAGNVIETHEQASEFQEP